MEKFRTNTLKWLFRVPGTKKLYILGLIVVQSINGFSGVLYALLLRNIVDSASQHNKSGFWHYVTLIIILVAARVGVRAVIRWLSELSCSTFENTFQRASFEKYS